MSSEDERYQPLYAQAKEITGLIEGSLDSKLHPDDARYIQDKIVEYLADSVNTNKWGSTDIAAMFVFLIEKATENLNEWKASNRRLVSLVKEYPKIKRTTEREVRKRIFNTSYLEPEITKTGLGLHEPYTLVELKTRNQLVDEGKKMANCLADADTDYYGQKFIRGTHQIFSLRNKDKHSYVTFLYDIVNQEIVEMEGYKGELISEDDKYFRAVLDALRYLSKEKGITKCQGVINLTHGSFVLTDTIETVPFSDYIESQVRVSKRTSITGKTRTALTGQEQQITVIGGKFELNSELPLDVLESLDLSNVDVFVYSEVTQEYLYVIRKVRSVSIFANQHIKYIPAHLQIENQLLLKNCANLETIQPVLNLKDRLVIKDCHAIQTLPFGINTSLLILEDCDSIQTLPDDIQIGRDVVIKNCTHFNRLPDNLRIPRGLSIENTAIQEFPSNLYVGRSMSISDEEFPIEKIPIGLPYAFNDGLFYYVEKISFEFLERIRNSGFYTIGEYNRFLKQRQMNRYP